MFESPAKRRKTTFDEPNTVDAFDTQSNLSTLKRASFQSPTKSSLARSHPDLLPQSVGESERQLRARSLRQELLGRRTSGNTPQASTTASQAINQQDQPGGQQPSATASAESESFSVAIAKRFTNEPATVPVSPRTPLRTRQPAIHLVDAQSAKEDFHNSRNAQPKAQSNRRRSRKNGENEEPDLPPTPVQLGLDGRPERPRGLASSSPSSGTSRSRSRVANSAQTSSPLKPRHQAQAVQITPTTKPGFTTGVAEEAGAPEEAPESDIEQAPDTVHDPARDELIQKRSIRDSLAAQLTRLKSDVSHLESAVADPDRPPRLGDVNLISLITTTNPSCEADNKLKLASHSSSSSSGLSLSLSRSLSPSLIKPTTLGPHPLKHLTLFAPGNLHLSSTTTTDTVHSKAHQIHTLEVSAPQPWPAQVFGATIRVRVDVEANHIVRIEDVKLRGAHQSLEAWIVRRLSAPLHRLDTAGLVWGMGRWWEECVRRSRGWRRLDERFRQQQAQSDVGEEEESNDVVHPTDVRALLPFLETVAMSLDLPKPKKRETRLEAQTQVKGANEEAEVMNAKVKAQLFFEWRLELDWTGEVEENLNLSVSGWGEEAQDGIQDTFAKIAKGKGHGVYRAMEAVWQILENGQG